MKTFLSGFVAILYFFLMSCTKIVEPIPQSGSSKGNTSGGTGGTSSNGGTNSGYVFQNDFARLSQLVLDENNDEIIQANFFLVDKDATKYSSVGGKVKIKAKNFNNATSSYMSTDAYTQFTTMSNMLQLGYKPTDIDSTTLAVVFVTDPSKKDRDGKQIIQALYLINDKTLGSGGFTINGAKKMTGLISSTTIAEKVSKDGYKLL